MVQFSFCIPTLNRAKELRASLTSIISQADESVEIVIIDGGSTDDTFSVIENCKESFPQISVYASDSRNGVDRDVLQSVAMARGTFCWLFSDDDLLEDGALRRVAKLIKAFPEVAGASLNYVAYDAAMSYSIATVPAAGHSALTETCLFSDRNECLSVLGIHMGFISCQIVRRSAWAHIVKNYDLTPHCNSWIIVYMIGRMLEQNRSWLYVHDVCVRYRSGNDSFTSRLGSYERQRITHIAYADTISSLLSPDSPAYRNIFKVLIDDRMPRSLAVLKSKGITLSGEFQLLNMYLKRYWSYPTFWIKVVPIFVVPNAVMRFVEKSYRGLRMRKAAARQGIIVQNLE